MIYSTGGAPPWQSGGFAGQPAFIPVPTRNPYATHLPPPPTYIPAPLGSKSTPSHTTVATPTDPSSETRKKIEWPPAVRDYVNRCFAAENHMAGIERPEMEKRLREVITEAARNNMLYTYNWEMLPLPQQMIAEDRRRTTLGLQVLPSNFLLPPPPPPPLPLSFPPGAPAMSHVISGSETLRKRKSSELSTEIDHSQVQPPWRGTKGGNKLEDRMSVPDKRQKTDKGSAQSKSNHQHMEQRKKRFEDVRSGSNSPRKPASSPAPIEPAGPVIGRSEQLEKDYFRLTDAPNPDKVRPLPILRQTLDLLKKKWRQNNNYSYINNQFKSLRQDLTVQHIKNDFTTSVYEIHARIALEKGDLGEYNQCQTQLRALYRQNLGGHPTEFKAYRILYYIYTCNRTDMNDVLSELTQADKKSPAVKHALAVRSALALGNYHQFFKLYLDPPNMGAYLMDKFIERERIAALSCLCRGYKPAIRLRFITEELAFESDEEAAQFILDHGGKELLEEKDDYVRMLTSTRIFEDLKTSAFGSLDP